MFFLNGIVFSFLLLKKGFTENRQESKWLGFFILLCSLYICPFMLGYAGWYSIKAYREFLFFIPFQQLFLIGPLYSLVIFVTDKIILEEFYFYADGRDKDLVFWYQLAGLISKLVYLLLSLTYYRIYRKFIVQEVSFADEVLFKWIRHFLLAFAFILLLRVFFFILNPEWGEFGSKYWYYLCFSILFYFIAITGYSNTVRSAVSFDTNSSGFLKPEQDPPVFSKEKEENEIQDLEDWKTKILVLIEEEKIYTNHKLTLTNVALQLNTNRNLVSSIINQGFEMNFNDFINSKRVEAVLAKIKAGEHKTNTLLGIALDCGFNSKTTFNRAFKKHTSLTPKQYIDKYGL